MTARPFNVDLIERWYLYQILPQEGSRVKMTLTKHLMDQIEFTAEEISQWSIKELPNGGFSYNIAGGPNQKDIFITPEQIMLILDAFKNADKQERLPYKMLDLFERFEKI